MFKAIKGYETLYSVSTEGEVINDRTGQILKPHVSERGVRVALYKDGKSKVYMLRLLVLRTFKGEAPHNHWPVNLDGDLTNNRLDNLAYKSRTTVVRANRSGSVKLTNSEALEVADLRRQKKTLKEIAEVMGVHYTTISNILKGLENET